MANWISISAWQTHLPGVRQSLTPALLDAALSHACLTAEMESISSPRPSPQVSASITQSPQHSPAARPTPSPSSEPVVAPTAKPRPCLFS